MRRQPKYSEKNGHHSRDSNGNVGVTKEGCRCHGSSDYGKGKLKEKTAGVFNKIEKRAPANRQLNNTTAI